MTGDLDLTFGFNGVVLYGNHHLLTLGGATISWHRWTNAPEILRRFRWQRFGLIYEPEAVDHTDSGWTIADEFELAAALHQFVLESLSR